MREKALWEQKSPIAIFAIYYIRSFLYPKEKSCKRSGKTCRFIALSLLLSAKNSFASPSSIFARTSQKLLGTTANFHSVNIFALCKWVRANDKIFRAYSAFADHEKLVKRSLASRFRRMFAQERANITCGERRALSGFPPHLPSDKTARFLLFCNFFFQKEKVISAFEKKENRKGRAKLTENYVRLFNNCSAVNK